MPFLTFQLRSQGTKLFPRLGKRLPYKYEPLPLLLLLTFSSCSESHRIIAHNQAPSRLPHTARNMAASGTSLATIGILSIGDMGLGIAKRLKATGFSVATNCKGRR